MNKDEVTEEMMGTHARKNRVPLILGITLAIIAIAVVVVVVIQANSPQRKFKKLLDQGREFLSELEYEKAIASIDEVLKIDPKNEEALELKAEIYLAWAKAEEKAGNHEEAMKLAKEGYESTENRKLEKLVNQLNQSGKTTKEPDEMSGIADAEAGGEAYRIYKSYLTVDKLNEGVAYYQSQVQKDPKDTGVYLFGAALCLVKDDAVSALTVLEAGIAAGADRDVLLRKEAYVRENTILAAVYGTVQNMEGYTNILRTMNTDGA